MSSNYTINKENYTIREDTEQAKLINNIYSKYNTNKYNVNVIDMLQETKNVIQVADGNIQIKEDDILTNINELVKGNVISENFYEMLSSEYIIYRTWEYNNEEITYSKIKIFTSNDYGNSIASIEIEKETKKIIAFTVKKEYVSQNSLQEYIEYLELDEEFTDWEYKKDEIISTVAGVRVTSLNDGKYISFSLQPFTNM